MDIEQFNVLWMYCKTPKCEAGSRWCQVNLILEDHLQILKIEVPCADTNGKCNHVVPILGLNQCRVYSVEPEKPLASFEGKTHAFELEVLGGMQFQFVSSSAESKIFWIQVLKRSSIPSVCMWNRHITPKKIECHYGDVWDGVNKDFIRQFVTSKNYSENLLFTLRGQTYICSLSPNQLRELSDQFPNILTLHKMCISSIEHYWSNTDLSEAEHDLFSVRDMIGFIFMKFFHPANKLELSDLGCEMSWKTPTVFDEHAMLEFLFRTLRCINITAKEKCALFTESFISKFVYSMVLPGTSMNQEYCKTVFHAMYAHLNHHRDYMRCLIENIMLQCIEDREEAPAGLAQLLEVFGAVVSGFALPLKKEHVNMLKYTIIPFHGVPGSEKLNDQLTFIVLQYIEKDSELLPDVLLGLFKYWPCRTPSRQLRILAEVADILMRLQRKHLERIQEPLIKMLCDCITDQHFNVASYALGILNIQNVYSIFLQHIRTRKRVAPALIKALLKASKSWNKSVRDISLDILKFMQRLDPKLYVHCVNSIPKDGSNSSTLGRLKENSSSEEESKVQNDDVTPEIEDSGVSRETEIRESKPKQNYQKKQSPKNGGKAARAKVAKAISQKVFSLM